jgi:hypothetical protein
MSDPMTNIEIEDVLSSIRRLVSEDLRGPERSGGPVEDAPQSAVLQSIGMQRPVAPAAVPQAKLVLTQALRVAPEAEQTPDAPGTGGDLWTADAEADAAMMRAGMPEAIVDLENAASLDAQLPEAAGAADMQAAGDWQGTLYGAAEAAAARADDDAEDLGDDVVDGASPTALEATIAELEAAVGGIDDGFEPDGPDPRGDYSGAAMDFADDGPTDGRAEAAEIDLPDVAGALDSTADDEADSEAASRPAVGEARAEADMADLYVIGGYEPGPDEAVDGGLDDEAEPETEALAMPVSGFAMDLPGPEPVEADDAAGDTEDIPDRSAGVRRLTLTASADDGDATVGMGMAAGVAFGSGSAKESLRSPRIIRPVEFGHERSAEDANGLEALPGVDVTASEDDEEGGGLFRHNAEAGVRPEEVVHPEGEPSAADSADAGMFDGADDVVIDADALRDLVAEIIREELQGALGERITRNVRKLVRREIARALETRDLE